MALALTIRPDEVITINGNITIQAKVKKGFKGQVSVSIQAPKEINISRNTCKNKEDNNVPMPKS